MNKRTNPIIFFVLFVALVAFACRGGAPATSVPVQTQPTQAVQAPTQEAPQKEGTLEIKSTNSYVDSFNDYSVVGEIVNNTSDTLENITLSLSITDENGTSLLKDSDENIVDRLDIQPFITVLAPGTVTPFSYYISADDVTPAKYDVTIKSYDTSSAPHLAPISIENLQWTDTDSGDIVLTGEVINQGSQQVDVESMAGGVLDEAGNILAANSTLTYSRYLYPAGDAQGRDRGPFIVRLYGPVTNATHWKVYARPIENSSAPSTNMEIQLANSYVDAFGSYHLLGTLKNNGSTQISPSVIGGLYTSDKKALFDAASLNIPMYLNAGDSVPFDIKTFQVTGSLPADKVSAAEKFVKPDFYWTFTTDYEVVALEAKNIKVSRDGSDWEVTGKVVNTTDKKLSSISVVVVFQDGSQQVMATNSTALYPPDGSDVIQPGVSSEFSTTIYAPEDWDLSSQPYQIIVQGIVSQ